MLYNILVPFSQDLSLLNVFRYITFRSAGALIFALLFTILTGPWFLKKLAELKLGQPILEYVPEHMSKAGTPTMGGLLIMAGALLSTLLWADLGLFYLVFAVVVLIATSNAVNLTDGLDGLAIMPVVLCVMVYAVYIYVAGHASFAQYLQVQAVPGVGEVTVFCCALMGAGLGFLWFNCYPAQVFMGDVGALSLGGVLGFLAVLCKQELMLIVAGGVFVLETVSVIMQVGFFKATHGKRLFRMTPLHHHFQKGSRPLPESKIIVRFWIVSVLLAIASLSVLKLR